MISGVRKYRGPVLLLVAFVLVVLAGFLYSSWHKHDQLSRNTCPFSGFERGVLEEPLNTIVIAPPTGSVLAGTSPDEIRESPPGTPLNVTRAPPVRSLSQSV